MPIAKLGAETPMSREFIPTIWRISLISAHGRQYGR